MLRDIKPKTARAARILKHREPQLIENAKTTLFLKSTSSSSLNNALITDLYALKRPLAIRFTKKNQIHPFEDSSSLEFFSQKNDASLLCFSSHSKKRPNNLTFIRTFNSQILDMLECLVEAESSRTAAQFGGSKASVGAKPLLSFLGPQFEEQGESGSKFRLAKSIFLDFFRGEEVQQLDVEGLRTMITFTASETEIPGSGMKQIVHLRNWRIITKRSGQRVPRVELEEMGPRIDFRLGRTRLPDEVLQRNARRSQQQQHEKVKKNIEVDLMGDKLGKIHMQRQDLHDLQTRKMKGLKRNFEGDEQQDAASSVESSLKDADEMSSFAENELSDRVFALSETAENGKNATMTASKRRKVMEHLKQA